MCETDANIAKSHLDDYSNGNVSAFVSGSASLIKTEYIVRKSSSDACVMALVQNWWFTKQFKYCVISDSLGGGLLAYCFSRNFSKCNMFIEVGVVSPFDGWCEV